MGLDLVQNTSSMQTRNEAVDFLTTILNAIVQSGKIPQSFKQGILFPIHKGGGKPKDNTDNYRGITVSSIIGKIFERILADHQDALLSQSSLQCGFTSGLSPTFASVIKTEAISKAKSGSPLFLATLDAQKAFDVVDHEQLLLKIFNTGLAGSLWCLKQDSYKGLQSSVRWNSITSDPLEIQQGVKQGGIPSTTDYKTYIDSLLQQLAKSGIGLVMSGVYCGAPTVADDVLLLSESALDLQTMLTIANQYAQTHKYKIHPIKSNIAVIGPKSYRQFWKDVSPWTIGDKKLPVVDCTTHLGITRDVSKHDPVSSHITDKLSVGIRTAYALMGSGLHCLNGLHPCVSLHIYNTYIIPRMISGLESVVISKKDMKQLETYHRKFLKCIQNLPSNTASCAVYTLMGALPIEATIEQNIITLSSWRDSQK